MKTGIATAAEFIGFVKYRQIHPAYSKDYSLKSRMGTNVHIDATNYELSLGKDSGIIRIEKGKFEDVPLGQCLNLPYGSEDITVFATGKSTHARRPVFVTVFDEEGKEIPQSPLDILDGDWTTKPVGSLTARIYSPSHPVIIHSEELIAQMRVIYNIDEAHKRADALINEGIIGVFDVNEKIENPKMDRDGNLILTLDLKYRDQFGNSFYISKPDGPEMDFSESGYEPWRFYKSQKPSNAFKYKKEGVLIAYSQESIEMGNQSSNGVSAFMPLECLVEGIRYSNLATFMQPSPSAKGQGHKRLFEAFSANGGNTPIKLHDCIPFGKFVCYKHASDIPESYRRPPNDGTNSFMLGGKNRHGKQVFIGSFGK